MTRPSHSIILLGAAFVAAPTIEPARGQYNVLDVVAPAPAAVIAEAGDDDPQVAAIRSQFEPMLKAELSFANRVCRWSDEQRVKAIAAARAWLQEFAREYAKNNGRAQAQMMVFVAGNGGGGFAAGGNQDESVEKKVARAVCESMTDEQRTAYAAEAEKRHEFRKQAAIENLVAQLDQRLELTSTQREKLTESLSSRWKDDWAPPLEIFVQMANYIPAVPDEAVLPHLTAEQKALWQTVQRISVRGVQFGGGVFGGGNEMIDDIDLNEGQ
jgi:hypothetical protein